MGRLYGFLFFFFLMGLTLLLFSCTRTPEDFVILSGSENKALEGILERFGRKNGVKIVMKYKGSIDMMTDLKSGKVEADAVWPASSIWLNLGDSQRIVKNQKSIMYSPVILGVKKSKAQELGLTREGVRVQDILKWVEAGRLRFAMTSASQSNSGCSAYIGFLYALADSPEVLTREVLDRPLLKQKMRRLLEGVNRSSGSSGWLKDLFLQGDYDAMVNYESLIIETNQELIRQGKEPLFAVYPVDGIVIADSPLGAIDRGDDRKLAFFRKLQDHLLSKDIQQELLALGRRTAFPIQTPPAQVWNPDWGIRYDRILSPLKLPAPEVLYDALVFYQTLFRKASFTVFALDFSGSMKGKGEKQLKSALRTILDPAIASQYLLHLSPEDKVVLMAFSNITRKVWNLEGRDLSRMRQALGEVESLAPDGGTDIYSPVIKGIDILCRVDHRHYVPAVVLMTDGRSNTGSTLTALDRAYRKCGKDIPVFAIQFGSAEEKQLRDITGLTRGKVFDGRKDLIHTFREVRAYH